MARVMVSLSDIYHVLESIIPLYIAMILAYLSVKWLKFFTPNQCSGINKFVAKFSIPLLSFQVVSMNNPYKMNLKIVYADIIQKFLTVIVSAVIVKPRGKFSWLITGLSLTTLPNTLILGIPMLKAMYGDESEGILTQIVVLQSLIWYNVILLLFEVNVIQETGSKSSPGDIKGQEEETIIEVEPKDERNSRHQKLSKMMHILSKVGKKLITNPNTNATLAGLIWACIHFRWGVKLPNVVNKSITILSDGGLGMAMFSLGVFMASQESIIACGTQRAILAISLKFIAGPIIMALCSLAVGLKGSQFKVAIVQAALPQGIVPFVFAKEYDVHPDILSTGVIVGLLIAIPIALAYFYLLAL